MKGSIKIDNRQLHLKRHYTCSRVSALASATYHALALPSFFHREPGNRCPVTRKRHVEVQSPASLPRCTNNTSHLPCNRIAQPLTCTCMPRSRKVNNRQPTMHLHSPVSSYAGTCTRKEVPGRQVVGSLPCDHIAQQPTMHLHSPATYNVHLHT